MPWISMERPWALRSRSSTMCWTTTRTPARSARPGARVAGRASRPTSQRSASRELASWRASCAARRSRRSSPSAQPPRASGSLPTSSYCESSSHECTHRRAAPRCLQCLDVRAVEDHRRSDSAAGAGQKAVAPGRRRAARVRARGGVENRRAPVFEPRHGGAHHRAALHLRDPGRPHRLGRRPPDLSPQDPHRAARGDARLRMLDGISGFPRRAESNYDTFGTAHSSTSISAALGMAVGAKLKNEKRHCIAVIGDGAMSAGMAYEAMNNAGAMDVDLLVILNDNEMSISPPVGALTNYLARLLSGRIYSTARRASEHL